MPEYELKVDIPERPKGDDIEVPPFGVIPNGSTVDVEMSKDDAERFRNSHGFEIKQTSSRKTAADEAAEAATEASYVPGITEDAKPATVSSFDNAQEVDDTEGGGE